MIKFGTSGFRGILADNFNKENVERVAYALLQVMDASGNKKPVYIGYDNRFMGVEFAKYIACVLASKTKVYIYSQSVPSPLISQSTASGGYGVMITASHNPFNYNGVKIFLPHCMECGDDFAHAIEKISNSVKYEKIEKVDISDKNIKWTSDISKYCNSILNTIDAKTIKRAKLRVLVNTMHGSGNECMHALLKACGVEYEIMNENVDPYFEHKLPAPYVYNIAEQAKRVKKEGFDVGIALDGDADRFTLIDEQGEIYDCNYTACVLYNYYIKYKGKRGGIVVNNAFTTMADKIATKYGFTCTRAKVGFKQIAPVLQNTDAFIGAESNGIAYKDHIKSKDGVHTAMAIIDSIATTKMSFKEQLTALQKEYKFVSTLREYAYPITDKQKAFIVDTLISKKKYPKLLDYEIESVYDSEGVKITYKNGFWVMVRFSGNEPVVRIFTEMPNEKTCNIAFATFEKHLGLKERQK